MSLVARADYDASGSSLDDSQLQTRSHMCRALQNVSCPSGSTMSLGNVVPVS